MKHSLLLISLVSIFAFFSCSKEKESGSNILHDSKTSTEDMKLLALSKRPQRSEVEALSIASSLIGGKQSTGVRTTQFETDYVLSQHLKKVKSESKSIPTDTLLFIINKGFCIISGDRRIPPVLAFSDYGHINKNDTI